MGKIISWVVVVLVVIAGAWYFLAQDRRDSGVNVTQNTVNNNTTTKNDVQNLPVVGTLATADDIVVDKPKLGETIQSPLEVTGRARGSWYFEASAPVMVIDTTGKIIGQGFVEAQGDWMTTEFVPFRGTIRFDSTNAEGGAVIFMNDNPSGDESRAKYLAVPVFFD